MSYTDEDTALAERRGEETVNNLELLMEGEDSRFRDARRAAVHAYEHARWQGRGDFAQMSAALHAALSVMNEPVPCSLLSEAPFDFDTCTVHDEVFAHGQKCPWDGKASLIEVLDEKIMKLTVRAVQAESSLRAAQEDAEAAHTRALRAEDDLRAMREQYGEGNA